MIAELPLPAAIGEMPVTVDCAADTGPAFTTTVAVCVTPTLIVAETVFDPAAVELRVPVATPLASVVPTGCVTALPPPAAAINTVAPWIAFPN